MNRPTPRFDSLAAWREAASPLSGSAGQGATSPASLEMSGYCVLCDAARRFRSPGQQPAGTSLREGLLCQGCHCNARQRAAASVLLEAGDPGPTYATEQASPFYVALRRRIRALRGSEFAPAWRRRMRLGTWLWRQRVLEWVRFGDVTRLGFGEGRFAAVASLDVLEHVPDFRAALREFARVLRPGGRLVMTVPFHDTRLESTELARIDPDGGVEHLSPPEYHGDPLGGGVLCFHHFGWDLLEAMREAGFARAEALRVQDPAQGVPEPVWVLRATR